MKTQAKSKLSFLAILFFTVLFGNALKAQLCCSPTVSFTIINSRNCSVTLDYKVFDPLSPTCATLFTQSSITIAALNTYTVPYTFTLGEDIEIVVNSLGAVSVNYGTPTTGGGNWPCYTTKMSDTGAGPPACSGSGSPTWNVQVWCSNALIW